MRVLLLIGGGEEGWSGGREAGVGFPGVWISSSGGDGNVWCYVLQTWRGIVKVWFIASYLMDGVVLLFSFTYYVGFCFSKHGVLLGWDCTDGTWVSKIPAWACGLITCWKWMMIWEWGITNLII